MRKRVVVVALLCGCAAGCGRSIAEAHQEIAEGEAVLAALEHVAAMKWGERGTTTVEGRLAVAYQSEAPLSEATRQVLEAAIEARGWRWSTEDPLVPTGNCRFPGGDCRLKDPTELHLTFSVRPWPGAEDYAEQPSEPLAAMDAFTVEPVPGQAGYKVHVAWLSSYHSTWRGRDNAELGGEGLLVTRQPEGWVIEVILSWIT